VHANEFLVYSLVQNSRRCTEFYRDCCEDQRKVAFIILQQTHGYWKMMYMYIIIYNKNKSVELICVNKDVLVNFTS
jgi:hypothetical protein